MGDWWKEAVKLQQHFCERLQDREWDRIECNQGWALEIKVAFALFGETAEGGQLSQLQDQLTNKTYFEKLLECCYTIKQKELIKRICDQIYKTTKSSDILVAFLFVVGDGDNGLFMQPFIRFKRYPSGDMYFLDILCRVYKNWDDYTRNNKLPVGLVLYPQHGSYRSDDNNKVLLQWVYTPATEYKFGIKSIIDKGVGVISSVLAGVGLVSMFTPIGPLAVSATLASVGCGVYGIAKGSSDIHDLRTHGENISPFTLQGFKSWFSLGSGVICLGSGLATNCVAELVASGKEVNKVFRGIVDGLNGAALTVNGVGILSNLVILVDKVDKGELEVKDVAHFSVSLLFFANSAVNYKTAAQIIEEVQNDVISSITSDLSKKQAKSYAKLVRNSGGDGTMEGRARIIKGIRNVESKDDFFRICNRAQKQSSSAKLNDKGKFEVGGKAYVDTDKKLQTHVRMNPCTKPIPKFFSYTKNDYEILTGKSLEKEIKNICIEYKKEFISLVNGIKIAMDKLYKHLANLFKKYFSFAKENIMFQGDQIINFINRSERFAQRNCCKTEEDFVDFTRFLILYKKIKMKEMENNYQREKNEAKTKMGEMFDESVFALKWGVKDLNLRKHSFLKTINDEMEQSLDDLQQIFEAYEREVTVLNGNGDLKFKSNYHALNEYLHCFVVDGEELSPSEFFSIIRKVVVDEKSTKTPHKEDSIISYRFEEVSVDVVKCGEKAFFHSVKLLM